MKKQNFITIPRCFANKYACLERLSGANFFAVLLVLFRTFAFSRLNKIGLQHAIG
jgi:hypothetical protein